MDMLENKKIREKINALDTLPETYHPNMASKWSLLEAGLDGKDNRRIIAWKRMAVAAALIMLVGSSFFFFNYNNYKSTSQVSEKLPPVKQRIKLTELQPAQMIKKDLQPVKKHYSKKPMLYAPVKQEEEIAVIPVKDSIVQPIASEKETNMLTTNITKRKKPRFVELDFNDSVHIDKPAETWAFRGIKFRTGAERLSFHEVNGKMVIGLPIF
jgi:hypothetical protein